MECSVYNKNNLDYRCSIDYDKTNYRKKKATDESKKERVYYIKVCQLINEFLKSICIESECIIEKGLNILLTNDCELIKRQYQLN